MDKYVFTLRLSHDKVKGPPPEKITKTATASTGPANVVLPTENYYKLHS